MKYLSAIVLLVTLCYAKAIEESFLPEYIHPCTFTDETFEKCVEKHMKEGVQYFTKGIPGIIPSTDPVDLKDIIIDGKGLKLNFSDAKMHGLSNVKLVDFKLRLGNEYDPEWFNLVIKGNFSLTAQYNADGKILILPIEGEGDALIECQNIEFNISSNLTHIKGKDGEDHFKLLTPSYKYDIESTTFDFKNLFNGNKQLAETTVKFANDNWHQLMDDLAPPVVMQIVKTIAKTINKFFAIFSIARIIIGYKRKL